MTNAISKKEKNDFIAALSKNLVILRRKAEVSQEEIANFIGVSRQSYGAVERCERRLSWNTYLALIFFFDYNENTRELLHTLSVFPHDLVQRINGTSSAIDISPLLDSNMDIMAALDEQAKQSIKNMIMIEYARCTGISGKSIVRLFEGNFFADNDHDRKRAAKALSKIKEQNKINDKN